MDTSAAQEPGRGTAHHPHTPVSLRLALVLGLLSAIGPFAIDMYLPALPQIGDSLGAPIGAVQAKRLANRRRRVAAT